MYNGFWGCFLPSPFVRERRPNAISGKLREDARYLRANAERYGHHEARERADHIDRDADIWQKAGY